MEDEKRTAKRPDDEEPCAAGCGRPAQPVKAAPAAALLKLVAATAPGDRLIPLTGQQVARRLEAAGRAAGVERRLTGHSGRVGLASELTARGASTADVMLAGGWKTARMVAHYSAGAAAERGAVMQPAAGAKHLACAEGLS